MVGYVIRIIRILFIIIITLMIGDNILYAKGINQNVFIKAEKGILRQSPEGGRIGEILQSTKVKVIDEQEGWVKIEVTGWIRKTAITKDIEEIIKCSRETKIHNGDFAYRDVVFTRTPGGTKVIGEMTNYTNTDYKVAIFTIRVYSSYDNLLNTGCIIIPEFLSGQTKMFTVFVEADFDKCNTYKISFERGL
jgi:hypothetical protein